MKNNIILLAFFFLTVSCANDGQELSDTYTGKSISYDLYSGSDFPISGEVNFAEMRDGNIEITVSLDGTSGDIYHPVHLHFGDLSTPDAEIALNLNDLHGATGKSTTIMNSLSNETPFSLADLEKFDGSVKIHLAETGDSYNVILAAGNVGSAADGPTNGRLGVAVCK